MKRGHYRTSKKGAERQTGYQRYIKEVTKRVKLIEKQGYEWATQIRGGLTEREFDTEYYKWKLRKKMKLVDSKVDITKELVKEYTQPWSDEQERVLYNKLNSSDKVYIIMDMLEELGDDRLKRMFNELYQGDALLLSNIRDTLKSMNFIKELYRKYKDKFGYAEALDMANSIYNSD